MITVNMHEAKTNLSKLVRAVVEEGEVVILQQHGKPVAEIHVHRTQTQPIRRLTPDPALRVKLTPGYNPTEPASEEEWPEDCR
jgi:antitoxin (DNA-binding transcriptional repressor) of toxin-antitoxin stability system